MTLNTFSLFIYNEPILYLLCQVKCHPWTVGNTMDQFSPLHRRRDPVNFRGHDIFAEKYVLKINKMPEFYMKIARIFCPNSFFFGRGGTCPLPPSPTPMVHCLLLLLLIRWLPIPNRVQSSMWWTHLLPPLLIFTPGVVSVIMSLQFIFLYVWVYAHNMPVFLSVH